MPQMIPQRRSWVVALAMLSLVAVVESTPLARAQSPAGNQEARTHYERGVQLSNEGAYDGALIEFQRAYDLMPNYRVLYNLGQVARQLNDFARALKSYEQYLAQGGSEIPNSRRQQVEQEISMLKTRVARIHLTLSEPGAEILVDNVPVGTSPLSDVLIVNAGQRQLSASKAGRLPVTKVVTVAGGDSIDVTLSLVNPMMTATASAAPPASAPSASSTALALSAAPSVLPPPSAMPSAQVPLKPKETAQSWPFIAASGFSLVGAAITGVLALEASNTLSNDLKSVGVSHSTLTSTQTRTLALAITSDTLSVLTVGFGVTALVLGLRAPSSSSEASAPSVQLEVGLGALGLSGRF